VAGKPVRFIRKGGRVIPIREPDAVISKAGRTLLTRGSKPLKILRGAAVVGTAADITRGIKKFKANPKQKIKVHQGLDALGLGLSVASGALGAATFSHGAKGLISGMIAGHAIDAGGIAANIASVSGKGKLKERATQAARQEARNLVIGNAVYAVGILAVKKNREKLAEYAVKLVQFARKALVRT
jgi:hypothetical protein